MTDLLWFLSTPKMSHIRTAGDHVTSTIPQGDIIIWSSHFQVLKLEISIHNK